MIEIDPSSSQPPFEQVRSYLAAQILAGELPVGARLPTVRALAAELGLAVNTVARAFSELERAGLVQTRGRAGTTVSAGGNASRERVQIAAASFAALVHELGLTPDEGLGIVRAALGSG